MKFLDRLARAWNVLKGEDELEQRALSFSCAALQILEMEGTWGMEVCRWIAHEAVCRKLGDVNQHGQFSRTVDACVLAVSIPPSKQERIGDGNE